MREKHKISIDSDLFFHWIMIWVSLNREKQEKIEKDVNRNIAAKNAIHVMPGNWSCGYFKFRIISSNYYCYYSNHATGYGKCLWESNESNFLKFTATFSVFLFMTILLQPEKSWFKWKRSVIFFIIFYLHPMIHFNNAVHKQNCFPCL